MITVTVQLMADMRRYLPQGVDRTFRCTLPPGSTVADLLATLDIPADTEITIGLDGELAGRNDKLRDGADVLIVSPMDGG